MNNTRSQPATPFGTHFSAFSSVIQYSIFNIQYLNPAFESDVAALASWKSASHVEVPPKTKKPPTPPTP